MSGTIGPDITLGTDGNVYGYSRTYDPNSNTYTYHYVNFGSANDPTTIAANSGIDAGLVQTLVAQQQVTLNNMVAQGQINPYTGGGVTQQQLTNSLDQLRTAQQFQNASAMQQIDPTTGQSYANDENLFSQSDAAFRYANQGQAQQGQLYGYQQANAFGANYNGASGVGGMSFGQLGLQNNNGQALQQYASQQNYNSGSGIGGMTEGQLGISNENSQAAQQYASSQNYNAANPYSGLSNGATGMQAGNVSNAETLARGQNFYATNPYTGASNGATALANSNSSDALGLIRNNYALTPSAYSGGQSRTAYEQGITDNQDAFNSTQSAYNLTNQTADNQLRDLNRRYDTTQTQYNLSNQGQQQALSTYRQGNQTIQAQNAGQSRNLSGMGFSGIGRPMIAGQS